MWEEKLCAHNTAVTTISNGVGITSQVSGQNTSWNLETWEGSCSPFYQLTSLCVLDYKCLLMVPDTVLKARCANEQADETLQGHWF